MKDYLEIARFCLEQEEARAALFTRHRVPDAVRSLVSMAAPVHVCAGSRQVAAH